jgi:cell fate regulator YaaT (PSP1 superfamily)
MKKYLVNLYGWENPRLFSSGSEFSIGDKVVAEGEFGVNIGTVVAIEVETEERVAATIIRKATKRDIEALEKNDKSKPEILKTAKDEAKRLGLEMKLIDAKVSLDGAGVAIIFTADGRVDFRELVKNLARILHRSVKMHQIGSRDEARRLGGCGVCGRELCCAVFLGTLPSISTEMARIQQVAHRGSDRISGQCGRLMCCLSYEAEQYRKLLEGMPEMNSFVKTSKGKGEVVELNLVKQEIRVRLEDGNFIVISKKELR